MCRTARGRRSVCRPISAASLLLCLLLCSLGTLHWPNQSCPEFPTDSSVSPCLTRSPSRAAPQQQRMLSHGCNNCTVPSPTGAGIALLSHEGCSNHTALPWVQYSHCSVLMGAIIALLSYDGCNTHNALPWVQVHRRAASWMMRGVSWMVLSLLKPT